MGGKDPNRQPRLGSVRDTPPGWIGLVICNRCARWCVNRLQVASQPGRNRGRQHLQPAVVTPQSRLITSSTRSAGNGGALTPVLASDSDVTEEAEQARSLSALLLPVYRRPRGQGRAASTPRRCVVCRARAAAVRSPRASAGPLGRKAGPRVPRNPAPLARKPPVLARHKGPAVSLSTSDWLGEQRSIAS